MHFILTRVKTNLTPLSGNAGREAGMHPGRDASQSQGSVQHEISIPASWNALHDYIKALYSTVCGNDRAAWTTAAAQALAPVEIQTLLEFQQLGVKILTELYITFDELAEERADINQPCLACLTSFNHGVCNQKCERLWYASMPTVPHIDVQVNWRPQVYLVILNTSYVIFNTAHLNSSSVVT